MSPRVRSAARRPTRIAAACGIAVALSALCIAGCGRPDATGQGAGTGARSNDRGEPSDVYTVRGRVTEVPSAGKPASGFQVHHEAIDGFRNGEGRAVGMSAMIMPFPLAEGVSLDGIGVGDVVEVTFAVWWTGRSPHWEATSVRKLPAETPLEFRAARPPSDDAAPTDADEADPEDGR